MILGYEHYHYYCYYHFTDKEREVQKIKPIENDRADLEECQILAAWLPSGSLAETPDPRLHPDLPSQNFGKIPQVVCVHLKV